MTNQEKPKFRIYPSIGIARMGNGKPEKSEVIFSPEVPWANMFKTDQTYFTPDGALKKQAQRFYIYECDADGNPTNKLPASEYDIEWSVEVANKKPFWYDFNNSMDLSVQMENHNNLSKNFHDHKIAPGLNASSRNPNIPSEGLDGRGINNYREELVNGPNFASVSGANTRMAIEGLFPFPKFEEGVSHIASKMNTNSKTVNLGTLEYDDDPENAETNGSLIFYGADGISASLNPSDLNTDFADNSNWYDDICDGRVTAKITPKGGGETIVLDDPKSAAWIATAPPDYAPQIQPISSLFDLICGADDKTTYTSDVSRLSLVLPLFVKFYRMQWVNLGDFLAPSFKEEIDKLVAEGTFKWIFNKPDPSDEAEAKSVRKKIFELFRNPIYDYDNEPIIPSKDMTDLSALGLGNEKLKLPYYVGDGINYPGSPAQWFAIPPMLYEQLKLWSEGHFDTSEGLNLVIDLEKLLDPESIMTEIGKYYMLEFEVAASDQAKAPLLMTRAVLETLYGGGFHPGVELTWPMRHAQMYKENTLSHQSVSGILQYEEKELYGLREIRINAASREEQDSIFYNDFGFLMSPNDVAASLNPLNPRYDETNWLWKSTPGDLTKWMGIPWQSDAGSCQAVWTNSQYPVPAWWAANLPIDVLTSDSFDKIKDPSTLQDTKRNIYASRQPWLQTTDTGYVGYHAEGGYLNGLVNMVYKWNQIGVVTGRKLDVPGLPETVYVAYEGNGIQANTPVLLGEEYPNESVTGNQPFYTNVVSNVSIPSDGLIILSASPDGTGAMYVDDEVLILVDGVEVYKHDYSNGNSGRITPKGPIDLTEIFQAKNLVGKHVEITTMYGDLFGGNQGASSFYLVFL